MITEHTPITDRTAYAATLSQLRTGPDGATLLNGEGRISFMGEPGLRTLGLSSFSDVVGKAWWEFWPTDQQDTIRQHFRAAMAGEVQHFHVARGRIDEVAKTGKIRFAPVPGPDGSVTSVLVVWCDATPDS